MRAGQTNQSVQRCPFLKKRPAYRHKQRSMFSLWCYYRRAFAPSGRMIVDNHCLILHIFPRSEGETREEVAMDVMNQKLTEREAELRQAHREELVERIGRALREDGTVQLLK